MRRGRIHRRLLVSYLLLILAALLPAMWLLDSWLGSQGRRDVRQSLTQQARVLAQAYVEEAPRDVPFWVASYTHTSAARITLIAPDGVVKGDSDVGASKLFRLENHAGRPEVRAALGGHEGWASRRSVSIGTELMYVAVPIKGRGGAMRLALPLEQVARLTGGAQKAVEISGLLALGLALGLGYLLSRLLTRPLSGMRQAALAMTRGDFSAPLPRPANDEIGDLVRALEELRRQLAARLDELSAERDKLRAILTGMTEGVALVEDGVIAVANPAFSGLLGISAAVEGRTPLEAARLAALAATIESAAEQRVPTRSELQTAGRVLEVHALPIGGPESRQAVAMLLDRTEAKQLERVRRDFVANASHELRTPVTAILGAAETLARGAAQDPQARASFIGILERHARRLARLTTDLLDLSRLEAGYRPSVESVALRSVVAAVVNGHGARAQEKRIALENALPAAPLTVATERAALEQILTNLVDNALKYTPEGGQVQLSARVADAGVELTVADTGPGIAPEHLPRLFERFYRVDDARSRALGGTGLGLAIVRHLAEANGGSVRVESELGHGTRFIVTLPLA